MQCRLLRSCEGSLINDQQHLGGVFMLCLPGRQCYRMHLVRIVRVCRRTCLQFLQQQGPGSYRADHVDRWSVGRVPSAASLCLPVNPQGRFPFMDDPWTTLALRDLRLSSCRFGFWSAACGGVDQSIEISDGFRPERFTFRS